MYGARAWLHGQLERYADMCVAGGLPRPRVFDYPRAELSAEWMPAVMASLTGVDTQPYAMPALFRVRLAYQVTGLVYHPDSVESARLQELYALYAHRFFLALRAESGLYWTEESWMPRIALGPMFVGDLALLGWTCEVPVHTFETGGELE